MARAETGGHTVILARGSAGPGDDVRLLRAVEDALRLPREHLVVSDGMGRPEFRLAEGIDGATAEELAEVARQHGYEPRVLARTGVLRSSRRNPLPFVATQLALSLFILFALRWLGSLAGPLGMGGGGLLFLAATLAVVWQWRRSIALPLIVPTRALLSGAVRGLGDAVQESADGALTALEQLRDVLQSDVPSTARGALRDTHDQLRDRVDQLRKEVQRLPTAADSAASALETRLATMPVDAPGREALQSALDQERESMDAAETRESEVIAELLAVRRAAAEAARTLGAAPDGDVDEVLERVRAQVGAVRQAHAELRRS